MDITKLIAAAHERRRFAVLEEIGCRDEAYVAAHASAAAGDA